MDLKQPTTYEQQVQLLKDKGFIVKNDEYVINFLKKTNYYCFSAYLLPYKISNSPEKYKKARVRESTYLIMLRVSEYFCNFLVD